MTPEDGTLQAVHLWFSCVWTLALYQPPYHSRTHKTGEKSLSIEVARYRRAYSLIGSLVERCCEGDFQGAGGIVVLRFLMDEPLGALDKQLRDLVVADSDGFMVKVPFTDSAEAFQTGHAISVCWAAKDCRALDPV